MIRRVWRRLFARSAQCRCGKWDCAGDTGWRESFPGMPSALRCLISTANLSARARTERHDCRYFIFIYGAIGWGTEVAPLSDRVRKVFATCPKQAVTRIALLSCAL